MKYIIKVFVYIALISSLILLTSAQTRYRNQRKSTSNEPAEQGRTLGLIGPLFGLGLNSIVRPFIGYDGPIASGDSYRPSSASLEGQSDPYYASYGFGNYVGYTPNYFNGYNYYGSYPLYRPIYAGYQQPFYGGYRPQAHPSNYGGYHQYNGYGGQRPFHSNSRPKPIAQRPIAGQPQATYPSVATTSQTTSGTAGPAANSAQAAQVANLLGQLLGQQLRPLLNQGAASPAHDDPGILEGKRYSGRSYQR